MHLHELLFRVHNDNGTALESITSLHMSSDFLQESWVNACNHTARALNTAGYGRQGDAGADAVIYRIDGVTEYFVSKYFYKWPNH